MIEYPEAKVMASTLKPLISNQVIRDVEVFQTAHQQVWLNADIDLFPKMLKGAIITDVLSSGGWVRIQCHTGDEIACSEDYEIGLKDQDDLPDKHQLHLTLGNGKHLYIKFKMYGFLFLGNEEVLSENPYFHRAINTIDPLSDVFTIDDFIEYAELHEMKGSVKAALATKQHIPGVGNGVLQDILFHAGIRPMMKVSLLSEDDRRRLYEATRSVLKAMVDHGGRPGEIRGLGIRSSYVIQMDGKNLICPSCGQTLMQTAYLGGKVIYCPHCQKE